MSTSSIFIGGCLGLMTYTYLNAYPKDYPKDQIPPVPVVSLGATLIGVITIEASIFFLNTTCKLLSVSAETVSNVFNGKSTNMEKIGFIGGLGCTLFIAKMAKLYINNKAERYIKQDDKIKYKSGYPLRDYW